MDVKLGLLFGVGLAAACSGKTKGAEDARHSMPQPHAMRDAALATPTDGKGDVQIRVEWKDVPIAARQSPGRSACGTARAPAVTPTTTWGIPDVVVMIDAPGTIEHPTPRIALGACALVPRVVLTGTHVIIASAADAPVKVTLHEIAPLPLGTAPGTDAPRSIFLPVAGHSVDATLDAKTVYRLDSDEDVAWIVASDAPFLGITEPTGQVVMRDVPAGPHPVTAWLPARAGQPQHVAHGTVTVTAGGLAELTLDISR